MPSGKQVLLHFLEKYSLAFQEEEDLSEVSEDLRVAMLLHGSTPDEMWYNVENIEWGNKRDSEDEIATQGLKIKGKDILLSELFEEIQQIIWDNKKIPTRVAKLFPQLTADEYKSAIHIIWLLLTAMEYSRYFSQVENGGQLDLEKVEKSLISYKRKMKLFRENPKEFLGIVE